MAKCHCRAGWITIQYSSCFKWECLTSQFRPGSLQIWQATRCTALLRLLNSSRWLLLPWFKKKKSVWQSKLTSISFSFRALLRQVVVRMSLHERIEIVMCCVTWRLENNTLLYFTLKGSEGVYVINHSLSIISAHPCFCDHTVPHVLYMWMHIYNASSRRNCSPMDLHFSFAATQLKFITHLISVPLFCGACWLLCPLICYDFTPTVWFELWTTLRTGASTVSGSTATSSPYP